MSIYDVRSLELMHVENRSTADGDLITIQIVVS